jgi:hypothetical protein
VDTCPIPTPPPNGGPGNGGGPANGWFKKRSFLGLQNSFWTAAASGFVVVCGTGAFAVISTRRTANHRVPSQRLQRSNSSGSGSGKLAAAGAGAGGLGGSGKLTQHARKNSVGTATSSNTVPRGGRRNSTESLATAAYSGPSSDTMHTIDTASMIPTPMGGRKVSLNGQVVNNVPQRTGSGRLTGMGRGGKGRL